MSEPRAPDEPPLHTWADALEAAAAGTRFDRIRVIAETASTQDAAARLAGYPHRLGGRGELQDPNVKPALAKASEHEGRKRDGGGTHEAHPPGGGTRPRPGLVVIAGRQTAGRGRHGRHWADTAGLGLAMTFAVDGAFDDRTLALAAGLAALRAAEGALGNPSPSPLGLKWPNDVIERPSPGAPLERRKLAGVLIERRGELALIGIGINVRQSDADWPPDLARRCLSLRMLGSAASRLEVARRLLVALDAVLDLSGERLGAEWARSEVQ